MKRSDATPSLEKLPGGFTSLWRTFSLGYRAEPRLLTISLGLALFMMVPDALLALWLKFLIDGVEDGNRNIILWAALGLVLSTTGTWYLGVIS